MKLFPKIVKKPAKKVAQGTVTKFIERSKQTWRPVVIWTSGFRNEVSPSIFYLKVQCGNTLEYIMFSRKVSEDVWNFRNHVVPVSWCKSSVFNLETGVEKKVLLCHCSAFSKGWGGERLFERWKHGKNNQTKFNGKQASTPFLISCPCYKSRLIRQLSEFFLTWTVLFKQTECYRTQRWIGLRSELRREVPGTSPCNTFRGLIRERIFLCYL